VREARAVAGQEFEARRVQTGEHSTFNVQQPTANGEEWDEGDLWDLGTKARERVRR